MKYRWIAQDKGGLIAKYKKKPTNDDEEFFGGDFNIIQDRNDMNIPNWRDSLIDRTTHDYTIEGGILIRLDKKPKTERHEYADVFIECAKDKTKVLQYKLKTGTTWGSVCTENYDFRIKPQESPKTKTVRYRVFLTKNGYPDVAANENIEHQPNFVKWLDLDWQEVEIPE